MLGVTIRASHPLGGWKWCNDVPNVVLCAYVQPYLHQSRHNHATRRIRGAGGRFLTAQEAKALEQSGELSGNSNSGAASSQPSDSQADSRTQQPPAPAEPASQGAGQNIEWNDTAVAAAAAPQGQAAGEQQPLPQDHMAQQNVPVQQQLDQAINSSQLAAGAAVRVQ